MKKIQLTQNKYTIVDDEDYKYLNQFNWYAHNKSEYWTALRMYKRKLILMHRIIMNCPKNKIIDHINGNSLDNRKENLRICTQSQNISNSKLSKRNKSGFKGVYQTKNKKKWLSLISINSKTKNLGLFSNKLEAKDAYTKAAKEYFGEFYSEGIRKEGKKIQKKIDNIKCEPTKRLKITNTSGVKGVCWHKSTKKWIVNFCYQGKKKYLGLFSDINEAKNCYEKEKIKQKRKIKI